MEAHYILYAVKEKANINMSNVGEQFWEKLMRNLQDPWPGRVA